MRRFKMIFTVAAMFVLVACSAQEQRATPKVDVSPEEAAEAQADLAAMQVEAVDASLLEYAEKGETETVLLLLKAGVAPGATHAMSGATALMVAANYDRLETAATLIEFGADLGAQDIQGDTALTRAASFGHTELARILIEAGADVDLKGQRGRSPLMQAVASRNNAIVELLVHAGADQAASDDEGKTARDLAEEYGNPGPLDILRGQPLVP